MLCEVKTTLLFIYIYLAFIYIYLALIYICLAFIYIYFEFINIYFVFIYLWKIHSCFITCAQLRVYSEESVLCECTLLRVQYLNFNSTENFPNRENVLCCHHSWYLSVTQSRHQCKIVRGICPHCSQKGPLCNFVHSV